MKDKIKKYFSFNKGERNGIFILLTILMLVIVMPYLFSAFKKKESVDFSAFEKDIITFEKTQCGSFSHKPDSNKTNKSFTYNKKSDNIIVEINSADSLTLIEIKGIGPVFAKRIIKYRNLLGGFYKKEQLLEVYGLDSSKFEQISSHITVNEKLIKKININTATFKELVRHPYIKYDLTKSLVNYRDKHGGFKILEDIRKCDLITESLFAKLSPYLTVE